MKRKPFVLPVSLILGTMMLAGSVAVTDVHADNLISDAQARDGTLVNEDQDDSQWHVDLSNQTLSNGSYIDYQFPNVTQNIKYSAIVQLKIKLKANTRYYLRSDNAYHVKLTDSHNNVYFDGTSNIVNQGKHVFFQTGPMDDVYTVTYDQFENTLSGQAGYGDNYPILKLYQVVGNNESIKIDFDKPMLGYGQTAYAYLVDSQNTDQFSITSKGVSSNQDTTGSYSVHDDFTYYPVLGYYDTGVLGRWMSAYDGKMDGSSLVSNGVYEEGVTPSAAALKFDRVNYTKGDKTSGVVISTPKYSLTMSGYNSKNLMKHLNFWNRFKSFLGDPVDTFSGAFVDQRTLMSYGGNNPLHFDISYNSITDGGVRLGLGYTHNFDSSLTKDNDGTIHVNWSPNVISDFKLDTISNQYIAVDAKQKNIQVIKTDSGYTVNSPDDGFYQFDNDGKLLSKKDKMGQVVTYVYDTSNRLIKVFNDRGQSYSFIYGDTYNFGYGSRLSKVTDGTGKSISFDYTSGWNDFRLSKVTFDNGKSLNIQTNGTRILSMNYDGNQLISNEYDRYGRVVKQTNANGTVATYSYDDDSDPGHLITKYTINGKTTTSVHDSSGNLLSQMDANGHKTTYDYNVNNQQVAKTDPTGAKSTYSYDDGNHVIKQTDPMNDSTNYLYDQNNLTTLTTPDGASAKLAYDDQGRLTSSTDKSGLQTTYQYDKFGNPTVIEKVKDGQTFMHAENQYDENGYLIATIVNGKKTSFTNDALGRKITETMPSGTVMRFTYDDDNNVLTSSVGDKTTKFEYDSLGNVTKKTLPNGHVTTYTYKNQQLQSVKSHSDDGLTQNYSYNSGGLLGSISVGQDTVAAYDYDDAGNVTTSTDYNGKQTTIGYDAANRQVSATLGDATTKTAYNADGQIASTTTGNGNTTSYDYDASGNVVKETLPDGTIVENTYDVMGHMLSSKTNGKTVTYEYDALGNRTSMTDAAGNKTSYTYNADGQVLSSTNALGHKTSYVYNDNVQLTQTLNNRGEVTAKYSYDDAGNVVSVSNSQHVMRTMTYDANNNLLTVKDANGDLVSQTELNSDEQVISTINALNSKSSVAYSYNNSQTTVTTTNALGHKKSTTTDYDGNLVKSADDITSGVASYDAVGNLSSQSVNNGQNKTSLTYDKDQNVVSEANNDGSESYSYDALDQLSSWTNARGDKTVYTRDADGNITNAKASDIDNSYGYDVNGNETSAKNSNADISKTYDALNRVVSKTQNGQTVKYNYDDREFLTDLIYPGDKKVHYDVNTDGQITAMTDWNNHKTTYDYDKNGRVVKTTNWNGVIDERSYNTAGQVLTIKTSLHDKTLTDYKYTYDSDGNLVTDNSQTYTYDMLDRLTAGQDKYTYDAIGNITSVGNHKMTYDDDSRLTSIDDNKTSIDKDGNLTNYSMGGKAHTASYNSQNQLTKYDDLSYTYDADGNRVSAGDTKFIYDDNGHLLSDGVNTYVYGASGVVGYYNKDGKFMTYLFNQRGDVVKETDESGSVINSFDYNDYGKLIGSDKAADSVFGYGGQYGAVTDKNGLIYLKTRYYNPEIMRFMNRDTVRGSVVDTKSLNRFAYVEGNPLTYVDPNGQAATWLKNNPLDALYYGLMGLSFVPGLNVVASIGMMTIDLAKGDYTSLAMDSLGILIPGAAVGLKLSYDGVRAVVDGLRVTNGVRDVVKIDTEVVRAVDVSRAVKSSIKVGAKTTETASQETKYEVAIADQVNDRKILEDAEAKVDAERSVSEYSFDKEYSENDVRFSFSKKYKEPGKGAKTDLPNAVNPQRHHILQNDWAEKYLSQYGYKKGMAPTITLETGSAVKYEKEYPHTTITNLQRNRKSMRANEGLDEYPSDLKTALENSRDDLRKAGLSEEAVNHAMSLVDSMLSHLNVAR